MEKPLISGNELKYPGHKYTFLNIPIWSLTTYNCERYFRDVFLKRIKK